MQENKQTAMNRRNFLRAFGGASTRYRETEHVKAFYRVNGYETLKK